MKKKYNVIFTILLGGCCCLPQKKSPMATSEEEWGIVDAADDTGYDEEIMDEEEPIEYAGEDEDWEVERVEENWYKRYKASKNRVWNMEHTDLLLELDFPNASIEGIAKIRLSPHFYAQDTVALDAKKLNIRSVTNAKSNQALLYRITQDSMQIVVYLNRKVKRGETLNLQIKYSTSQGENRFRNNGAIAGDDGYYFINSKLQEKNKPRQFWTQGETESNSRWFPTLDAPNQKHTQKIEVIVPDTMKVLSNGIMIKSVKKGGKNYVAWEQTKPHAVYLTMLAVGNWEVVKDQWKNKTVDYWVEKPYKNQAKAIFGNTPEMIQFFSDYTGVTYPWDKYSQVVVRDFVSGAMENTSATVHMQGLQQSDGDLLDNNMEDYVSHELFHQWFGDYVTAESWGNITLNESFATYGEYLWQKHKYGAIAADETLYGFRTSYDNWGSYTGNTLLRHEYSNTNDMFDVTSYQKGALILHMLQYEVGEKAFKESIHLYLTRYAFKNAEVEQLRLCFEEVTGKDLGWFFDQWYKKATYPSYDVLCKKDTVGNYKLSLYQAEGEGYYTYGKMDVQYSVKGMLKNATFTIDGPAASHNLGPIEPDWLVVNPKNTNLGNIHYTGNFSGGILDFRKIYLAYMNVTAPSVKSLLWNEFEDRTGGFMEEVTTNDATEEDEGIKVDDTHIADAAFSGEFKREADSLRVIMMKHAMVSKSQVLAKNVLFPYFNHRSNASLGKAIGLDFIEATLKDKSNPSIIRNQCFNIIADLGKDSNFVYSYVSDPSISVSNSAIARIWKKDELQKRIEKGLKNPEIDIANRWFLQSIYQMDQDTNTYNYYIQLKSHPFYSELAETNLIESIFRYGQYLMPFAQDLIKEGNQFYLKTAQQTVKGRIEILSFGEEKDARTKALIKELEEVELSLSKVHD